MSKIFLVLMLFLSTMLSAEVIGAIKSVKGVVKSKGEDTFKKVKVKAGFDVNSGDLITTSRRGAVEIILKDGSTIILDASSTIHFGDKNSIEQEGGKIFYKITSRDAKNSLKIKTPFAIIGIKGTTFVIDGKKDGSVSLKEGLIGVKSLQQEFELYREKVQQEFDNYISKQQSAFEQFKNAQNEYAIAESVKEFDLKAGNRISFNGQKVNENSFGQKDNDEFEHFKELMNSMQ